MLFENPSSIFKQVYSLPTSLVDFSVKDFLELIEKTNDIKLKERELLVSFNVTS